MIKKSFMFKFHESKLKDSGKLNAQVKKVTQRIIDNNHFIEGTLQVRAFHHDDDFVKDTMTLNISFFQPESCNIHCSPSDYYKGGRCDKNGCYH